jgi:hypothetical protein
MTSNSQDNHEANHTKIKLTRKEANKKYWATYYARNKEVEQKRKRDYYRQRMLAEGKLVTIRMVIT